MRKLLKYLFQRPDVKAGDKLSYYNRTCMHVYFSWKDGLWFVECEDVAISWGVEQFYRKRNQACCQLIHAATILRLTNKTFNHN